MTSQPHRQSLTAAPRKRLATCDMRPTRSQRTRHFSLLKPIRTKIRLKTKAPGSEKKSPTKQKSNRTPHYFEKSFRSGAWGFHVADRHPWALSPICTDWSYDIFSAILNSKLVCFFRLSLCHILLMGSIIF